MRGMTLMKKITARQTEQRQTAEAAAKILLTACGFVTVIAVCSITIYMILNGTPALFKIGPVKLLFSTVWNPDEGQYGILYIIITSIAGTCCSVLLAVPTGVLTAVFLAEIASEKIANIIRQAVGVLAGIPSVIFGLIGIMVLNPFMQRIEEIIFSNNPEHQFTGGANFLSAVLVLAIMILPTVINISESAIRSVPQQYRNISRSVGATEIQTIFQVVLPAARSGIITSIILGTSRAVGEAMAISLVSGSAVNFPLPFNSVRFLTTAIVQEMSYATGLHREVLFTIGLVLFVFIMVINVILTKMLKKEA